MTITTLMLMLCVLVALHAVGGVICAKCSRQEEKERMEAENMETEGQVVSADAVPFGEVL